MGRLWRWWMWLCLAGLLGLAHWAVVDLANQRDATVRALYWDPVGLGLAAAAIGLRLLWWTGGPAMVAIGLAQGIRTALNQTPGPTPNATEPDA